MTCAIHPVKDDPKIPPNTNQATASELTPLEDIQAEEGRLPLQVMKSFNLTNIKPDK